MSIKNRVEMLKQATELLGFLGGTSGKGSSCQRKRHKRGGFDPWVRKIPCKRKWQSTPVFLPGKFQGQRSLVGYSSWDCKELDMTEHIHTTQHNTLNCTGPTLHNHLNFFWMT